MELNHFHKLFHYQQLLFLVARQIADIPVGKRNDRPGQEDLPESCPALQSGGQGQQGMLGDEVSNQSTF